MSNKKLINISLLKTMMMMIIVLYHSMLFFNGTWFEAVSPTYKANYLVEIAKWMNTFHIQVFTMASGFLYYYLRKTRHDRRGKQSAIKKRAKRLLLPYLFTSILWAIPITLYLYTYSFEEIVHKFAFGEAPSQLWYLLMLFLVFVFFELIGHKIKVSAKNFILITIVSIVVGYGLAYLDFNYFQISKAIQFIPFFYLGGYIYHNKSKITRKQILIMTTGAMALYVAAESLSISSIKYVKYITTLIMPLVSILEVSVIYYVFTKISEIKKINTDNKLYKLLEENSFGIYLFHQQIIYFTILILNGNVHPIVQVLLSFIISLSTSLLISAVLRKHKTTKAMFGL